MYSTVPSITQLPADAGWRKRIIGYGTEKLWQHLSLLLRLHYKSQNQHHASRAFHRLQEVKRVARRLAQLESWLKINFQEKVADVDMFKRMTAYIDALRVLVEKVR